MNKIFEKIMERLKKKENEAILKAPNTGDFNNPDYQKWMMKSFGFKESMKIVQEVVEEYNNGWIPCSERLPDRGEIKKAYCRNMYGSEFIVMIEGATLPTALYRTLDGFWVDERREIYKVIAWQPLPAPYNDAKQQED